MSEIRCSICDCPSPKEPEAYPCNCYGPLCIPCFEGLFAKEFKCLPYECYRKRIEVDGSITFAKIKQSLYTDEFGFYCSRCFMSWGDHDFYWYDNCLITRSEIQDCDRLDEDETVSERKLIRALTKALCRFQKMRDSQIQRNTWFEVTKKWLCSYSTFRFALTKLYLKEHNIEISDKEIDRVEGIIQDDNETRKRVRADVEVYKHVHKICKRISDRAYSKYKRCFEKGKFEIEPAIFIKY